MLYCLGAKKSRLQYRFGTGKEVNIEFAGAIDVQTSHVGEGITPTPFSFTFDGSTPDRTYSFELTFPGVSEEAYIYLLDGTWDDYGSIGSYSTGAGVVKSYSGNPLLVGRGNRIQGSVVNLQPVDCYARGNLAVGALAPTDTLVVRQGGVEIYRAEGYPLKYHRVYCDDGCPAGFCKCPTNSYPGYCCLDCKDVAAKLNNLSARCQCA